MNDCKHAFILIMRHGGRLVYKCPLCGAEQAEKPVEQPEEEQPKRRTRKAAKND